MNATAKPLTAYENTIYPPASALNYRYDTIEVQEWDYRPRTDMYLTVIVCVACSQETEELIDADDLADELWNIAMTHAQVCEGRDE